MQTTTWRPEGAFQQADRDPRHSLQKELKEVRQYHESSRQPLTDPRTSLKRWFDENKAESKSTIDQRVKNRDNQQLAARAQRAEECAWTAIRIAEANIDEAAA